MYKIIGADGRQYGPIATEQLRQWIVEGRANAQTQTLAEGATEWKPLAALPAFAAYFAPQVPPAIAATNQPRNNNSFAIAGFIFGIVAFLCCCKFLFGALGIIFSLIGLSQISQRPDLYEGRGLAIAGIILSVLSILIALALILFWLASGSFHYWNINQFGN